MKTCGAECLARADDSTPACGLVEGMIWRLGTIWCLLDSSRRSRILGGDENETSHAERTHCLSWFGGCGRVQVVGGGRGCAPTRHLAAWSAGALHPRHFHKDSQRAAAQITRLWTGNPRGPLRRVIARRVSSHDYRSKTRRCDRATPRATNRAFGHARDSHARASTQPAGAERGHGKVARVALARRFLGDATPPSRLRRRRRRGRRRSILHRIS